MHNKLKTAIFMSNYFGVFNLSNSNLQKSMSKKFIKTIKNHLGEEIVSVSKPYRNIRTDSRG